MIREWLGPRSLTDVNCFGSRISIASPIWRLRQTDLQYRREFAKRESKCAASGTSALARSALPLVRGRHRCSARVHLEDAARLVQGTTPLGTAPRPQAFSGAAISLRILSQHRGTSTSGDDLRTGAVEHNVLEGEIAAIRFLAQVFRQFLELTKKAADLLAFRTSAALANYHS